MKGVFSGIKGYDLGLRQYMIKVYQIVAAGLLLSAISSFVVASVPEIFNLIFGTPLRYVFFFLPLILVSIISFGIDRLSQLALINLFCAFAIAEGIYLSAIFLVYTGESILSTFFIAATVFGSMSIYGYTTKRDLTSLGSFLFMGLLGLVMTGLVNLFLQSSAVGLAYSVIGLAIFVLFTAYDVQKIKEMYNGENDELMWRKSLIGALQLHLDFINIFLFLLRFLGVKNDRSK